MSDAENVETRDIVPVLRERPYRKAHETEDQSKIRRQRERELAADEITRLRSDLKEAVEALERCVEWIESDEAAHGRTFGAGVQARTVLKKAKGEE